MTDTTLLALPLIAASQAAKHVTHNEAMAMIDALLHLSVLDRDLAAPPVLSDDGDRHIVAAAPTGAWSGHAGEIAWRDGGAWRFLVPGPGWTAWVADENLALVYSGSGWAPLVPLNPTPLLGVNATADASNRLLVSSPNTLFNHAGAGHQMKINKAGASETASLLLQTAYVGQAEIGLAGDDNLRIKTRADDWSWRDALVVDRNRAMVAFPQTAFGRNLLINGDFAINQRNFAGGALSAGAYGFDRWKADAGGASLSLAGDVVTLASGGVAQVIEAGVGPWGVVALSVEDLSGGSLTVTVAGAAQTFAPASGRQARIFDLAALPATTDLDVKLAPAAGAVSFKRVKLEQGASASAWLGRSRAEEMALCQRYFQVHRGGFSVVSPAAAQAKGYGALPVAMRATPTPAMVSSAEITMPGVGAATVSAANLSSFAMRDASVFVITLGGGAPSTGAGQAGFLHDATLQFSAEL